MPTLYTQAQKNIAKTWAYLTGFFVFVVFIGWFFAAAFGNSLILYVAIIFALVMNFISYWYSHKIVLMMHGAKEVKKKDNPELHRIVENLAITAGLPKPKIYLMQESQPNAFATGRNPKHAVVAVTEGLLQILDRKELEGVLAHELSHIGNRDILISTIAVVLAGFVAIMADFFLRMLFFGGIRSNRREGNALIMIIAVVGAILAPIAATMIRLAISRKREFLADASGALLTRHPESLASALQKISRSHLPLRRQTHATAHLFIANPLKEENESEKIPWLLKLFMTHPPINERIKALMHQ